MKSTSMQRPAVPAALAWGTFAGMAGLVARYGHAPFDAPVLEALHRRAHPKLDQLAVLFSVAGNTKPMVTAGVLAAAGLAATGRRRAAWQFALGVGGSMLLTQIIKRLAARPRPTLWVSRRPEHTYSFPSGHAMDTAALAAALYFAPPFMRRAWVPASLFAAGVGWSRLYLGVHFPSDVLAGWGAGAGWVLLVQARVDEPINY